MNHPIEKSEIFYTSTANLREETDLPWQANSNHQKHELQPNRHYPKCEENRKKNLKKENLKVEEEEVFRVLFFRSTYSFYFPLRKINWLILKMNREGKEHLPDVAWCYILLNYFHSSCHSFYIN